MGLMSTYVSRKKALGVKTTRGLASHRGSEQFAAQNGTFLTYINISVAPGYWSYLPGYLWLIGKLTTHIQIVRNAILNVTNSQIKTCEWLEQVTDHYIQVFHKDSILHNWW